MTDQNNAAQAWQDTVHDAILILTEEADALSDCHTRAKDDWAQEPEAKARYDHILAVAEALSKLRAPVAGEADEDLAPPECPITRRPLFMAIEHPELGMVPTYGGPFDSYTIPYMDGEAHQPWHERELFVRRYDHDLGGWRDDESIPLRVIHEDVLHELQDSAPQASTVAGQARDAALWREYSRVFPTIAEAFAEVHGTAAPQASEAECSCPSGNGSLRHPCPVHSPADRDRAALGIPQCGGPLCGPVYHHPLCRSALSAQPAKEPAIPEPSPTGGQDAAGASGDRLSGKNNDGDAVYG